MMAARATAHCLAGCAVGEVLGMVLGTALAWHNAATVVLSVALAFICGYSLTMLGLRRMRLSFRSMVRVALAADTVSILVMEIIDNAGMIFIPGAMTAGLASGLFWYSLAASLLLAFIATTPINKWLIGKGKGHAVAHAQH